MLSLIDNTLKIKINLHNEINWFHKIDNLEVTQICWYVIC